MTTLPALTIAEARSRWPAPSGIDATVWALAVALTQGRPVDIGPAQAHFADGEFIAISDGRIVRRHDYALGMAIWLGEVADGRGLPEPGTLAGQCVQDLMADMERKREAFIAKLQDEAAQRSWPPIDAVDLESPGIDAQPAWGHLIRVDGEPCIINVDPQTSIDAAPHAEQLCQCGAQSDGPCWVCVQQAREMDAR